MGALPIAVSFGHVAPVRPASQDPQHSIYESAVVSGCAPAIALLAGKQILDLVPLSIREFVAFGHLHLTLWLAS